MLVELTAGRFCHVALEAEHDDCIVLRHELEGRRLELTELDGIGNDGEPLRDGIAAVARARERNVCRAVPDPLHVVGQRVEHGGEIAAQECVIDSADHVGVRLLCHLSHPSGVSGARAETIRRRARAAA
jgi:hypothetical protein